MKKHVCFEGVYYNDALLRSMDEFKLNDLIRALSSTISDIAFNIKSAKEGFPVNGRIPDASWIRSASYAKKMFEYLRKKACKIREDRRLMFENYLNSHFVDVAKDRLSEDVFMSILREARSLSHQQVESMKNGSRL